MAGRGLFNFCFFPSGAGAFSLALVALFLVGCSLEQPGVKQEIKKSAIFSHSGQETECASCHERNRPAPAKGFAHGGGQDCIRCHQSNSRWANPRFAHNPVPASCTSCHAASRPQEKIGRFAHASPVGQGECAACHSAGAGDKWSRANFAHDPEPESCQECHLEDRPQRTRNQFDHEKDGTADCAKCHAYSRQEWRNAAFFHGEQIESCNRCHDRDRPRFRMKSDGADGPHFPEQDCFSCHQAKGGEIEHFEFGHRDARKTKVNTCLPCHLADGRKKHEGDGKVNFEGKGNCFECHTKRKSWDAKQ